MYSGEDWELAEAMKKSLRMEARHDPFLAQVLAKAETQRFMVNKNQCFQYGNFKYTLDTRCKWDWWLPTYGFETPEIELVGLCTGICVLSNAILCKATFPESDVSVDAACCACVTPQSHDTALSAMKLCQIDINNQGSEPWRA